MNGYVLLLDLLGFSNIVRNLPPEDLHSRIEEWITLIRQAAHKSSVTKLSMLSDTVFAAADPSEEGLKSLIAMAKAILDEGIKQSFPVKGAIVFGEYTWGNLIYGKAVIDAHELESQQTWIGVSCATNLPHIETVWGFDSLLCYPTPKKSGSICLHPVISWNPPEYEQFQSYLSMKGLARKGEFMSWSWADRVQHTIAFALYKSVLVGANGSPDKFHGMLPIQVIGLNMKHA